ncbi:MAG: amino acid ABC transporter substrate-binding protein [Candidatus Tectimicrobiota bacterium]
MKLSKRSVRVVAMLVVGALLVGGFVTGLAAPAEAQGKNPIRIGGAVSLTGKYGRTGEYQLEGYKLWVKQVNERGGLLGRPVELVVYDDKSDPATSRKLYEKLLTLDKVDLCMAPYSSAVTFAVAPVTDKYRCPILAAGAASIKIWKQGHRYIFMMASAAKVYLEGAIVMAAERGLKTAAMVAEDSLFPKSSAKGAKDLLKKHGIKLLLYEEYPKGKTDFSTLLQKIKALKPDLILGNTYFPDAVILARQMKEFDLNPKMFAATVGAAMPDYYKSLGKTAEYIYGPTQWDESLKTPGNQEFFEDYIALHNRPPDYHSAAGYSSGVMVEEAVKRAGSIDRDKVRDQLAKLEISTVWGDYRVDQNGIQVGHKMVFLQWQDGKAQVVWPTELATAEPRFPTPPWDKR